MLAVYEDAITFLCWNRDGSGDRTARIWKIALEPFAPDSRRIAAAGFRGPAGIHAVPDGAHVRTLIGHFSYVRSLSFAPDGRALATGSEAATVKLWDMDSDRDLCTLTGFADSVLSVTFAAQGDALITCSNEQVLRLWPAPLLSDINAQSRSERSRNAPW